MKKYYAPAQIVGYMGWLSERTGLAILNEIDDKYIGDIFEKMAIYVRRGDVNGTRDL